MIFQLRTDNHIDNNEEFEASVRGDVENTIVPLYGDRLRRVEVYVEDVNAKKGGGADIRCNIEVHIAGRPAVAAHAAAADVDAAIDGAIEKVLRVLEHQLGKQEDRAGHPSAAGPQGV